MTWREKDFLYRAVAAFFSFGIDQNDMIDHGSMFDLLYRAQLLHVWSVFLWWFSSLVLTLTSALLRGWSLCPIVSLHFKFPTKWPF